MARLLSFGYHHSRLVLVLTILFTAIAFLPLRELQVDLSSRTLFDPDNPVREQYEAVRETFGSDQIAMVYARSAELFTASKLQRLKALNDELAALPFVERVDSLFTLPDIRDVDGYLELSPLLEEIPASEAELEAKEAHARENPLLRRSFLSEDGKSTALNVFLKPEACEALGMRLIHDRIAALLAPHEAEFGALFQIGKPAINTWMLDALTFDQIVILPAAGLILLTLLIFNLRSTAAGFIPILNGFFASLWTIAIIVLLGIPINLLNYIVPVLLLVIGATEDVHIIHEYRRSRKDFKDATEAIRKASERIGLAILLTALTTMLGFAATGLSDLPVLQQFGITAFTGVAIRFLVSIVVLPALLRLAGDRIGDATDTVLVRKDTADKAAEMVVTRLAPQLPKVLFFFVLISGIALVSTREIRLSNDLMSFINEESTLRKQLDEATEHLSGSKLVYLTLYDEPGAFLRPFALERVQRLSQQVRTIDGVDAVTSFADLIARINEQLHEGDPAFNKVPESHSAVKQMLLFANPDLFTAHVTPDYATANITIRCSIDDSDRLNEVVAMIGGILESGAYGRPDYSITGDAVLVASAVGSIVKAQVFSLGSMIVVLFVIISCLFLSTRCGAITVAANLFSIVLVFGLMGLAGIPLNVGTCMVAAITLGIAIDDTLHILIRFNRRLKERKDEAKAIHDALRNEINPIIATSLALAGGFVVLSFSSFAPVREFGYLSAIVILLALITDLVLIPVLFARTRLVTLWDVLGLNIRRELLEKSPFFKGLTPWQAKKIVLASHIEEFPEGAKIISENEVGDTMFVVVGGELAATLERDNQTIHLADMSFGDVIGEVGMVAKTRRSADITAKSDARLLSLNPESMEALKRFSPYLASRIFLNLSTILALRLAEQNKKTRAPF